MTLDSLTQTLSGPKARAKIAYLQVSDGLRAVATEELVKTAKEARAHVCSLSRWRQRHRIRRPASPASTPYTRSLQRVAAASCEGVRRERRGGAVWRVPPSLVGVRGGAVDGLARSVKLSGVLHHLSERDRAHQMCRFSGRRI